MQTHTVADCQHKFELLRSREDGYFSGCNYKKSWPAGLSLDECIDAALDKGANIFNYKIQNGECNLKRCVNINNPELSTGAAGYDVYIDYCE